MPVDFLTHRLGSGTGFYKYNSISFVASACCKQPLLSLSEFITDPKWLIIYILVSLPFMLAILAINFQYICFAIILLLASLFLSTHIIILYTWYVSLCCCNKYIFNLNTLYQSMLFAVILLLVPGTAISFYLTNIAKLLLLLNW